MYSSKLRANIDECKGEFLKRKPQTIYSKWLDRFLYFLLETKYLMKSDFVECNSSM